ncbi:MAG TPA: RdgB/HAM1 family non-canonical purine NTP pyrophosphatase [Acidimicrobiales bacterium]|nr:RdgB/HAM1 family non-canonical purine NTP pyrophosphatase [Acidimicrobiales bacterium]
MSTSSFVLATANPDKARELRAILGEAMGRDVRLLGRPAEVPEVDETGSTLEENARLKAVALVEATGIAAIADDTGLEVAALGGAPGVYSSRYAGEQATYADNVAKLLAELGGSTDRRARFTTVALARFPDGSEVVATGIVDGEIALSAVGASGFGYDPVFVPTEGDGRTFAEMSPEEKHALSHRGRAFRSLAELLAAGLPAPAAGPGRPAP